MGFLDPRLPAPTRASNIEIGEDGGYYLVSGADEAVIYPGDDGNYYLTPKDGSESFPAGDPPRLLLTEADAINIVREMASALKVTDAPFNAKGDGVTDDSGAVEAWSATPGFKFAPAGNYRMTREAQKHVSNSTVYGAGIDRTRFFIDASVTGRVNGLTNYSNNHASRTNYDENIHIFDMTVDGNAWNRSMPSAYDGMNGSAVTLSTVRNSSLTRVKAINGYLHNIDIGASEYPAVEGINTYAAGPSYNVVVRDCQSVDSRLDDGMTTHYSHDIIFENPVVTRTRVPGWTQQGIEIDDGSWRVKVINGYVSGHTKGYQAKGHSGAPAAYDVTFRDCIADGCVVGFDIGYDDPTVNTASAGIAKDVLLDNCRSINLVVFPDPRPDNPGAVWYTDTRSVQVEGYIGVRIRNHKSINCGLYGGITVGDGAQVDIDGFDARDVAVGATDKNKGLIHFFNSAGKGSTVTNVKVHTPIGIPVVVDSSGAGQLGIDHITATGTDNTVPCVKLNSYGGTRDVYRVFSTGFSADITVTGGTAAGDYIQGMSKVNAQEIFVAKGIYLNSKGSGTGAVKWEFGNGSPEGVLAAWPGSMYARLDGTATTTLYVKTSGTGSTGWTAK